MGQEIEIRTAREDLIHQTGFRYLKERMGSLTSIRLAKQRDPKPNELVSMNRNHLTHTMNHHWRRQHVCLSQN